MAIKKKKAVVKKTKVLKAKNDSEFIENIYEIEQERIRKILAGENVSLAPEIDFDTSNIRKKDGVVDKKLHKNVVKSPKRNKVLMLKVQCPQCNKIEEVPQHVASAFELNIKNTNSTKPLYKCNQCKG